MKKRILSALMAAIIGATSFGAVSVAAAKDDLILSDTTKVNVENTDTCFAKVTDAEYHADMNYYMHFKSEGDWLEVTKNLTENVTAGSTYVLTVVAKPVSGTTWFRIGWDDTGWLTSAQEELATDLGDGWFKYVKEVTMTADQSNVLFHNEGAAEIYVESISLKPVGEDKELIASCGFDTNAYSVNVENTDVCFAKVLSEEIYSDNEYSLHFKTPAAQWLEVTQNLNETAVAGGKYVLSAWVKPVSGRVWFRIGWDADGWMVADSDLGTEWVKVEKEVTLAEDQTNLLFHNAEDRGDVEFYIDDISLKAVGSDVELMPDGGFDEVTVNGVISEIGTPDEKLILSNTTTVNNTETAFAKVTDNTKNGGNYSIHYKSGTDHFEVSQKLLENTAKGETYLFSAYVKMVKGQVWFRIGWDNAAWMAVSKTEGEDEWVKVEKEVTIEGNDNNGDLNTVLFHNAGETECYIDDISLVKVGETTELMPDGGFEEVTIEGEEPPVEPEEPPVEPDEPAVDIPDEDLILSDTTKVSVENTDTCYAKVTDNEKNSGNYGLHLKATAADWIEVTQSLTENAVTGEKYVISAYVKPVQGRVWFRLGWDNDAWLAADATLGTEWVKVEKEVTVAGNEGDLNTLIIHNDGATEFYIDDISVVKAGTETELVPDGGFEEVTVKEPTVDIPDEDLILSGTTHINVENTDTCFAKVTDNEKNSGSYGLHFKAAGSDWLEVDQTLTETAVAGGQYVITAYIKPVAGTVWFRIGWDETGWMISSQEGTVQANGWTKIERTVTLTADQTKLLFHNDGATEFYIDDISLKAVGSDVELMPDGGFEEVTVFEQVVMPEGPKGEYVLNSTKIEGENTDTRYAEPTKAMKRNGEYSLRVYTEKDYLEFSQEYTEPLAEGTYTLTWYAKGEGTLWFYSNWGVEVNPGEFTATHVVDSAELQADGWTKYTKSIYIDGVGDTKFLFCSEGAVDVCMDDVSLVDANGVNYIADGGFENVKLVACTGDHVWDEGVVTEEATHTKEGSKTFACTVCTATKTELIEKTPDHDWGEGVVTLEPTVDAEGVRTYTCACGETKTEAIEKLPAPSYRLGDANGDAGVDVKDVITIRRHITGGYGVTMNEAAADVNTDGAVDVKDAIMIRRFITGGYGVEL